ncbi:MAG: hypothetical protein AAF527_10650 [Pseudomonadota bacterium]
MQPELQAFARYHSEGGSGWHRDYVANVASVLKDLYVQNAFANVLVIPSFEPEYGLALLRRDNKATLLRLEAGAHLWSFEYLDAYRSGEEKEMRDGEDQTQKAIEELEANLPASRAETPIERCELALPDDLSERLFILWGEMLFRTRHVDRRPVKRDMKPPRPGLDGTTYHFTFTFGVDQVGDYFMGGDRLAGWTWSPSPDSTTGRFVAITELLEAACASKDGRDLKKIQRHTDELLNLLSQSRY